MTVRLVISVDDAGTLSIAGPIEDPILCYGLLEMAKDAVREASRPEPQKIPADQAAKITVMPAGSIPNPR